MGWENRNGKAYYYRKEWENGRCVSTYLGAGDLARFADWMEESRREERACYAEAWRLERGQMEREDKQVEEAFAAVEELMEAALLAAGFHQHKRTWRRKRCPKQNK